MLVLGLGLKISVMVKEQCSTTRTLPTMPKHSLNEPIKQARPDRFRLMHRPVKANISFCVELTLFLLYYICDLETKIGDAPIPNPSSNFNLSLTLALNPKTLVLTLTVILALKL